MVNPGHPSNGCATCRFRRIKCDEAYPTCLKCVKSRRVCLGYDSQKRDDLRVIGLSTQGQLSASISQSNLWPRQRELVDHNNWVQTPNNTANQFTHAFFVVTGEPPISPAQFESIQLSFDGKGPSQVVTYALETIQAGFQLLWKPEQTHKVRRKQHEEYRKALLELRLSLISSPTSNMLFAPTFLFALYEVRRKKSSLEELRVLNTELSVDGGRS
jgi:Fungal Zn(2)-Cys(6) binuclear cluster domain